jgi:hypothetical protein
LKNIKALKNTNPSQRAPRLNRLRIYRGKRSSPGNLIIMTDIDSAGAASIADERGIL